MANVKHSALTGSDLHECKGAATASAGQVPVANGSGIAPFATLSYSNLSDKPAVPQTSYSGSVLTGTPLVKHYLVTTSSGIWTQALSGFTTIHSVQATARGGVTPATAAIATVGAVSPLSISGAVMVNGTAGSNQPVYLSVYGV